MEQIEKAISKLAELELEKSKIEKEMSTKASAQEVEALRASLAAVNESIATMMSAIEAHTKMIESLQVTEDQQEETQKSLTNVFRKDTLMKIKDSKFLNFNTSVAEIDKMVKKAVTAEYAGSVRTLQQIDFLNLAMSPTLLSLFATRPAQSGSVMYLDLEVNTDATQSSETEGCFLPLESDMELERNIKPLTTYRNWTTVCDTHLEDYPELANSIAELLLQGLVNAVDKEIIAQLDTLGKLNTTLPSYTFLANSINECNIYDLMLIHTSDMITTTRGKFVPKYMILNPVTAAGLMARKSANTYLLQQQLGLNGMAMPTIFTHHLVPEDRFFLISDRCGVYYTGRDASVELATQDAEHFRRGIVTLRGSERGMFLITLISSFGVIRGDISSSIANYTAP
jgi:hypothetical protein